MGRTGLEHCRRGQQKAPLLMGDGHHRSLQGPAGQQAPVLMGSTCLDASAQRPSRDLAPPSIEVVARRSTTGTRCTLDASRVGPSIEIERQ